MARDSAYVERRRDSSDFVDDSSLFAKSLSFPHSQEHSTLLLRPSQDFRSVIGHQEGLLAILSNVNIPVGGYPADNELAQLKNCGEIPIHNGPEEFVAETATVQLPSISYVLRGLYSFQPGSALSPPRYSTICDNTFNYNKSLRQRDIPDHVKTFPSVAATLFSTDAAVFSTVCEPLSRWLAGHIWDVAVLGPQYTSSQYNRRQTYLYPAEPLPVLAESISSLLLSTSLQPSVIVLSLYYISLLPAYIGSHTDTPILDSLAYRFNAALTDVDETMHDDTVTIALYACFKLFVTVAILSNKMLDDHVFTLRTWHEVSGIPLKVLNSLEWMSLDLLSHDLSMESSQWARWIHQLNGQFMSYTTDKDSSRSGHESLQVVVGCMLHYLSTSSPVEEAMSSFAEPIFLGLGDRISEQNRESYRPIDDERECDLDEYGPLRDEYIPKNATRISTEIGTEHETFKRSSGVSPTEAIDHANTDPKYRSSWPRTPLDVASPQFLPGPEVYKSFPSGIEAFGDQSGALSHEAPTNYYSQSVSSDSVDCRMRASVYSYPNSSAESNRRTFW